MRKLTVGDKVRFLNSIGGGVVKGFLNKQVVLVEDESGFDIPILISEVVAVDAEKNDKLKTSEPEPAVAKIEIKPESPRNEITETPEGENITTCLVYLPSDMKNISNTSFECYFVNDSNYYLFFNYMNRENNSWCSRYNGIIEPNTQIFIEVFDKSQLNELEKICVQFVAFKHNKPFGIKNPVSVELRIDTVKFYKLHSFTENDYFDDNALVYYISKSDAPVREILIETAGLKKAMMEKNAAERRPRVMPTGKKTEKKIIEIDLHINELLDNTSGMDNVTMQEVQLQKFNETMQENLKYKGKKIVFIHGKGEGVLKSAILKELKQKYKSCYFQDASFREYGYGATMVTIR